MGGYYLATNHVLQNTIPVKKESQKERVLSFVKILLKFAYCIIKLVPYYNTRLY
jgi:hypothetical protein